MLDPRTKLLLAIGYAALIVASNRPSWSLAEGGALLLFIAGIGKTGSYLRWLRMALPMSLFFGAVIWWTADVRIAALAALKLLTLVSVFFVFFSITLRRTCSRKRHKLTMHFPTLGGPRFGSRVMGNG